MSTVYVLAEDCEGIRSVSVYDTFADAKYQVDMRETLDRRHNPTPGRPMRHVWHDTPSYSYTAPDGRFPDVFCAIYRCEVSTDRRPGRVQSKTKSLVYVLKVHLEEDMGAFSMTKCFHLLADAKAEAEAAYAGIVGPVNWEWFDDGNGGADVACCFWPDPEKTELHHQIKIVMAELE